MAKSKSKSQKRKQARKKQARKLAKKLAYAKNTNFVPAKTTTIINKAGINKAKSTRYQSRDLRLLYQFLQNTSTGGVFSYLHFRRYANQAYLSTAIMMVLIITISIGSIFEIRNLDAIANASKKPIIYSHIARPRDTLNNFKQDIARLKTNEVKYNINLVDTSNLWSKIDTISNELLIDNNQEALNNIKSYAEELKRLKSKLITEINRKKQTNNISTVATPLTSPTPKNANVPIVLYHYTPSDFDAQLSNLSAKGYSAISLDNLSDNLRYGRPLPPKPVIITFDDGFKDQLEAFEILKRHNMKATFYIITSGEASRWCIGAGRKYDQNPSCGDDYMSWDDVIKLDRSGIIEIASHTVDHLALPIESPQIQQFQISESKKVLEQKLGHPIYHFAYPYGSYNVTSVELVGAAGFLTAVTTMPGSNHDLGSILTLSRERDAFKLP